MRERCLQVTEHCKLNCALKVAMAMEASEKRERVVAVVSSTVSFVQPIFAVTVVQKVKGVS